MAFGTFPDRVGTKQSLQINLIFLPAYDHERLFRL